MQIAVHNGKFHADDIFACAVASMIHPFCGFIRTRDPLLLKSCEMRIDVGGVNNPETMDFDHHMKGGAGSRLNGVPYAAFGLMWKKFGLEISGSGRVRDFVDDHLVSTIDSLDCGIVPPDAKKIYSVADAFDSFNPSWDEDENEELFLSLIPLAVKIISNEIKKGKALISSEEIVRTAVRKYDGEKYLVLPRYCPWQKIVSEETDFLYVVFPDRSNPSYRIRAVPVENESFEVRKKFPENWAGLRDVELENECGIKGALFCHPALFIAGAATEKSAAEMAEAACHSV